MDLRQKPLNPIKLLKLCMLLQFEQMLIVLETDDQIEIFKIILKEIEQQIINASDQNKLVTNFTYATNERFSFDLIQKLPLNPDLETKYLETNFVVTNVIDNVSAEVVVFNGALFKGQKLYIDKEAIIIQKIVSFNREIALALQGMIVEITIDKKIQFQEGNVGCYNQILLGEIHIEVFSQLPIQENPLCVKAVTIEKKQKKLSITLQFSVKRQLMSLSRWPNIISFSNLNSQIIALGIVRQIPKVALSPVLLIPTYGFEQQFIEENETLRKFICRCRSCKMAMIDTVMIPCGHVRYCSGCADMMRECYYCDQKSHCCGVIKIKECNPNIHRLLIKGTLEEEFVDHTNFQVLPKLVQFEMEQQALSPNLYFKCVLCFKELISHVLVDKNLKYQFVCNYCANQASRQDWNIVKIQYQCL